MSRVQGSSVSKKRDRWFFNIVLVLVLASFIGAFTLPLLAAVFKENQPSSNPPSVSTQSISAVKPAELEAQARGYELVLQREPDNRTALRGLLDVRLQLADMQGAIVVLEKLAKLNPEQTDYMVLLAQAKQQVGDREGAAMAYRSVLTSKPGDMNALQGLVSLLLEQKRPEAAIGLLQETLKGATQANQIQPSSVDVVSVQLLLGQVYVNEQRNTEAIAIYDEAIKYDKQDFRPVLAKAIVLQQLGKIIESKLLFTSAVSLAPSQYKDQIKQMASNTPKPTNTTSSAANSKSNSSQPAPNTK